ncbi:MerR family transcriptional regulator [Xylocopilactobacillus apicola]|uniref:MerR family transcriptional regulator n=1 Tax=Xylocopilactobacillus apicola TaxID=2932184 RepID=UPI0029542539|nr:MerR family transcriptional regulator [Xylocopilactobacillus apicola]
MQECAKKTNCSKDTLRFYDKKGLVSPRRGDNGYRDYGEEEVELIELIQTLKFAGLNLNEVQKVLKLIQAPISPSCRDETIDFLQQKKSHFQKSANFYLKMEQTTEDILKAVEKEEAQKIDSLIWELREDKALDVNG